MIVSRACIALSCVSGDEVAIHFYCSLFVMPTYSLRKSISTRILLPAVRHLILPSLHQVRMVCAVIAVFSSCDLMMSYDALILLNCDMFYGYSLYYTIICSWRTKLRLIWIEVVILTKKYVIRFELLVWEGLHSEAFACAMTRRVCPKCCGCDIWAYLVVCGKFP